SSCGRTQTSHALLSVLFGLGFVCVGTDPSTGVAHFTVESIEHAACIRFMPIIIDAIFRNLGMAYGVARYPHWTDDAGDCAWWAFRAKFYDIHDKS
ncbi:MAG: hypothetical protein ACO25E_12405, partial [Burkholderiaceae bacterium]